jgi:hypothetical protein
LHNSGIENQKQSANRKSFTKKGQTRIVSPQKQDKPESSRQLIFSKYKSEPAGKENPRKMKQKKKQ